MYCSWRAPWDCWPPFSTLFKGGSLLWGALILCGCPVEVSVGLRRAFWGGGWLSVWLAQAGQGDPLGELPAAGGVGWGRLPTLGPSMLSPAAHCPHQCQVPDAGRGQGASQRAGRPRLLLPGGSVGAHAAGRRGPPPGTGCSRCGRESAVRLPQGSEKGQEGWVKARRVWGTLAVKSTTPPTGFVQGGAGWEYTRPHRCSVAM